MKRRALIISNPGEKGAENYCEGVFHDVSNYKELLVSPFGGCWRPTEIHHLHRPTKLELKLKLLEFSGIDYALVIFSGHGYVNPYNGATIIELKDDEEIESASLTIAPKQTLILDCCRVVVPAILTESRIKMAKRRTILNPEECRKYYDERIVNCDEEMVVMYACSKGQKAGDASETGGIYSYSLYSESKKWVEENDTDTSSDYSILSVVKAHELAKECVISIRGQRQTPQIEKPRSSPYFPFAIVA